jgi:hypothetical protein
VICKDEVYQALQNLAQFLAALLFRRYICPDTFEARVEDYHGVDAIVLFVDR